MLHKRRRFPHHTFSDRAVPCNGSTPADVAIPAVTFDRATHSYSLGGNRIPLSVTQVLDLCGVNELSSAIPYGRLKKAQDLGTKIHDLCTELDEGSFDPEKIDEAHAGYVLAYHRFIKDHSPEWELIEEPYASAELKLAGTPDRVGTLNYQGKLRYAIVDLKTPVDDKKAWGLQLTGYAMLTEREDHLLLAAHLHRDGTYTVRDYEYQRNDFLACCAVAQWRLRNGVSVNKRGRA